MAFTSYSSSHFLSDKIPRESKARNCFESIACIYEIPDLLPCIPGETQAQTHMHACAHTHAHTSSSLLLRQSISRRWIWQRSVLFTGHLLHLTFIMAPGP